MLRQLILTSACLISMAVSISVSDSDPDPTYASILANTANAYSHLDEASPVNTQFHAQTELGEYSYGYSNPTSSKVERKAADGSVEGSYSYLSPDGRIITNNYVADRFGGFRSSLAPTNGDEGTLLPTAAVIGSSPYPTDPLATDIGSAILAAEDHGDQRGLGRQQGPVLVSQPERPFRVHPAVPPEQFDGPPQQFLAAEQQHPLQPVAAAAPVLRRVIEQQQPLPQQINTRYYVRPVQQDRPQFFNPQVNYNNGYSSSRRQQQQQPDYYFDSRVQQQQFRSPYSSSNNYDPGYYNRRYNGYSQ